MIDTKRGRVLANELGKAPPIINVQDNGYVVRTQVAGTLKNVFMHLLRNSVDHGLETPEERLAQKKSAAGTIYLEMDVKDNMLRIKLSDDGRGLALARIRKIALEKGLINADKPLDDDNAASLILRPGFTTAQSVTEVSGRGVGMDAVLNFVKHEGGKIEIGFTDDKVGAEFRQFETVVYLPKVLSENVEGFHFHPLRRSDDILMEMGVDTSMETKITNSIAS